MTLDELLTKIESTEKTANMDPDVGDPRSRIGRETAKRMAEDELGKLKMQYEEEVKRRALCIFLEGDAGAQAKFAEIAEDEAESLTLDASKLYNEIGERVFPMVGNGRLTTYNVPDVVATIKDIMRDIGIRSMPMIALDGDSYIPDKGTLTTLLKDAVRAVVDDDLNKAFMEHNLVKTALATGYKGNAVGVVVINANEKEREGLGKKLCSGNSFTVKVPENINKDTVLKALLQVQKKAKTNKTNN